MPTPAKPFNVLMNEKKSHRTKAELQLRQAGEEALISKISMKEREEVKQNKLAHKEFKRIKSLLKNIEKDDAIYENVINRYSMLLAECLEFEEKREKFYKDFEKLENEYEEDESFTIKEYYTLVNNIQKHIIELDKQIQAKRKMMLEIEKESVMTIASALRNIPKKVDEQDNPLLKVLRGEC